MKRYFLLPALLVVAISLQAQQPTTVKPPAPARLKTMPEKLPDLRVNKISATYTVGQALVIDYEVVNTGTAAANMNDVSLDGFIYLNYAERPGGGTVLKQGTANNMLEPGQTKAGTMRITTTLDKNQGTAYSYKLLVDQHNAVKESNENNNSYAIQINIVEPPPPPTPPKVSVVNPNQPVSIKNNNTVTATLNSQPELSVKLISVKYINNAVQSDYEVTNSGTAAVEVTKVVVQAYIIDNTGATNPAGGAILNFQQGVLLKPGETMKGISNLQFTVTLDRAKTYTYKLVVDPSKQVAEVNENNNEATAAIVF